MNLFDLDNFIEDRWNQWIPLPAEEEDPPAEDDDFPLSMPEIIAGIISHFNLGNVTTCISNRDIIRVVEDNPFPPTRKERSSPTCLADCLDDSERSEFLHRYDGPA